MIKKELTGDLGTGGRPRFGAGVPAKEKSCVDCGVPASHAIAEGKAWSDKEPLRRYGDEYACHPCSNGGHEDGDGAVSNQF